MGINPWWLDWFIGVKWWVFGGLGSILALVYLLTWLFPKRSGDMAESYGSAHFGDLADAEAAGLTDGSGVVLGIFNGVYLRISSAKHTAFVGPSDAGKSSQAVSTLLSWPDDVFVLDQKGPHHPRSLTTLTMPYRASTYGPAYLFAPADPYSPHRVNPYDLLRWETPFEAIDVQRMSIRHTTRSDIDLKQEGPSYYRHGAQGVLFLGLLCLHYLWHHGKRSPSGLRHLLIETKPPYIRVAQKLSRHPHGTLRDQALYLSRQPPRDLAKWWADAINHLSAWVDPVLSYNTDVTTIPLKDLQTSLAPMSVYVHLVPEDAADRLGSFFQGLVQQLRTLAHESLMSTRRRLLVLLDDMGELKRFPIVQNMASFDRDVGWRLLLLFQSYNQLWEVLGVHASLLDNIGALVAFRPNHPESAQFLSRALDQQTIIDRVERRASGRLGETVSAGDQAHGRALLTPREIQELDDLEALLFVGGRPPFRVRQARWYEHDFWAACVAATTTAATGAPGGVPARATRAGVPSTVG